MQHSEQFAQVAAALAAAQGAFPLIERTKKVTVKLKNRDGQPAGEYSFRYAPLETILAAIRGPMAANGLALVQSIVLEETSTGAAVEVLRTTMIHSSGEWFACDVPMFVGTGDNKSQAYASGVTYARRYGVTMLTCVAADEDDDGNGGDQDKLKPDYERQQQGEPRRGSFPRQGGGRSTPPDQQQPGAPRQPVRRDSAQADASRETHQRQVDIAEAAADAEAADAVDLFGADLSGGQVSMLKAAQLAAGLSDDQVRALTGPITADNFKAAQATLKAEVNRALAS